MASTPEFLARFSTLLLTTYRKDGRGVRTPVWCVGREGRLYVRTGKDSWKVKRIRRTPEVLVAPATITGSPMGPGVTGRAREMEAEESAWIEAALARKYGLQKKAVDLLLRLVKVQPAYLEIQLAAGQ